MSNLSTHTAVLSETQKQMPDLKPLPRLVLASGSPRRKELLASLNLAFDVIPSTVDESAIDISGLSSADVVCKLAHAKAEDVAKQYPDALVLGSDTLVILNGDIFGKPKDKADATRMLTALQGTTHQVYTGITLFYQGRSISEAGITDVVFKPMTPEAIASYIETGEPMDKAGAYAIQGFGSLNVERINGCYFNVVGLSLPLLQTLVSRFGFALT